MIDLIDVIDLINVIDLIDRLVLLNIIVWMMVKLSLQQLVVVTSICSEVVSKSSTLPKVLGSNPDRVGFFLSRLCMNSDPNCSKAWGVLCCLWYRVL